MHAASSTQSVVMQDDSIAFLFIGLLNCPPFYILFQQHHKGLHISDWPGCVVCTVNFGVYMSTAIAY